jgi:uncharacterized membrane protein HdeD (DUF308 family)
MIFLILIACFVIFTTVLGAQLGFKSKAGEGKEGSPLGGVIGGVLGLLAGVGIVYGGCLYLLRDLGH